MGLLAPVLVLVLPLFLTSASLPSQQQAHGEIPLDISVTFCGNFQDLALGPKEYRWENGSVYRRIPVRCYRL